MDARRKYKPELIQMLFIAEAPPSIESKRFFYYEKVEKKDSLFWELMKVLYLGEIPVNKKLREEKIKYLEQFKRDGYYLEDSVDMPFQEGTKDNEKCRIINEHKDNLLIKLRNIISKDTPIILISKNSYFCCYNFLKENGFNVKNNEFINFPGSGQQKEFKRKIKSLLKSQIK
jgi:hypothetical protein